MAPRKASRKRSRRDVDVLAVLADPDGPRDGVAGLGELVADEPDDGGLSDGAGRGGDAGTSVVRPRPARHAGGAPQRGTTAVAHRGVDRRADRRGGGSALAGPPPRHRGGPDRTTGPRRHGGPARRGPPPGPRPRQPGRPSPRPRRHASSALLTSTAPRSVHPFTSPRARRRAAGTPLPSVAPAGGRNPCCRHWSWHGSGPSTRSPSASPTPTRPWAPSGPPTACSAGHRSPRC